MYKYHVSIRETDSLNPVEENGRGIVCKSINNALRVAKFLDEMYLDNQHKITINKIKSNEHN